MYCVEKYVIKKSNRPELFQWCKDMAEKAKLLNNATLYRLRQHFTSLGKSSLNENQQEVESEIARTCANSRYKETGPVISFIFMDKLMRITHNPDFFAGLPMQTAQLVVKQKCKDFKAWNHARKDYEQHPEKYTGKPKMPKYCKKDIASFFLTNQDCRIKQSEDSTWYLKFPLTKEVLVLNQDMDRKTLKEVKVIPFYGNFEILVTYEKEETMKVIPGIHIAAIDFGINNVVALVSNDGKSPLLYKGGILKSTNQWYNKQLARLKSILMKGHDPKTFHCPTTKQIAGITRKRNARIMDEMHKISSSIVQVCLTRGIGTIILGHTPFWKQEVNIGKRNNQNFVQIPFSTLINLITYKAYNQGIRVVLQEESYTSKTSFLDQEPIPTKGKGQIPNTFVGKRFTTKFFRSKNGTIINADINGAANILRKCMPNGFRLCKDFEYLLHPHVIKRMNNTYAAE